MQTESCIQIQDIAWLKLNTENPEPQMQQKPCESFSMNSKNLKPYIIHHLGELEYVILAWNSLFSV